MLIDCLITMLACSPASLLDNQTSIVIRQSINTNYIKISLMQAPMCLVTNSWVVQPLVLMTTKTRDWIIQYSWSRRDVTAYITITIKPEILRILHHDIWGTVSVFIVDLNADIRGGFTNLTADYQKLRLEIGVGI